MKKKKIVGLVVAQVIMLQVLPENGSAQHEPILPRQDKGGTGALYINRVKSGEAHFNKSLFRGSEGISIGKDILTTVTDKYSTPFAFTGKLRRITIDLNTTTLLGLAK